MSLGKTTGHFQQAPSELSRTSELAGFQDDKDLPTSEGGKGTTLAAEALRATGAEQMSIYSAPPPPSTSDGEAEARKRRRIRFSNATPAEIDAGIWDMPAVNSAPKWGRGVIIVHHDDSESRAAVRATYPASAWRPPPTKNAVSLAIKEASTEDSGVNGLTAHRPLASSTVDPASPGRSSETANALDASSLSTTDDRDVGGLTLTEPEATQQVSGSTGLTAHRTAHRTRASSTVDPAGPGRSSETDTTIRATSLSTTDDMGGGGFTNKKSKTSPQDSGFSGAAAHEPRASSTVDPASPGRSSETDTAIMITSLSTTDDMNEGGFPNKKPKAAPQDSGFCGGAACKPRAPSPADPASPGKSSKTATTLGASSLSTTDGSGGNGVANTTIKAPPIVQSDCESDASTPQTTTEVTPDVTSTGVQIAVRHANDDKDAKRPPTRLTSAHTAAAIRLGMQSAGLTWIQQANAADAATSHAPPPPTGAEAPPCEEPGRALIDVPMIGERPRYEREIVLPAPDGFIWPEFLFIAFYEHSGEEREANARSLDGAPTCSVADRRSILPPSEHSWHFIGPVQDFLRAYPHPVRRQSNHVPCGAANWASWHTWPKKIMDGSMLRSAEEFLWINCIGDQSLGEQPPTAHQHTVGPPTHTRSTAMILALRRRRTANGHGTYPQ